MRTARLVTLMGLMTGLTGCYSTRVDGWTDPAFERAAYTALVVYVDSADELLREKMERTLADILSASEGRARKALRVATSLDILSEPRLYSEEEIRGRFGELGFDAIVRVRLREYGSTREEYPGGVSTVVGPYGGGVVFHAPTVRERTRLYLDCELIDRRTGRRAWSGEAAAAGGADGEFSELLERLGAALRHELRSREMIQG